MKLGSVCVIASAIGLAGAVVSTASAAVIVNQVTGGPFSPGNPLGTIMAITLSKANTYDFTFTVSPAGGSVLTQVQASVFGASGPQSIKYSLYSGTPGSGSLIDTSALGFGPSLTDVLGAGTYFLEIDSISKNGELLTGGLDVIAAPEPATWGLMLLGFSGVGAAMRSIRRKPALATA